MTETTEQDEKTPLTLSRPGKLELKKTVESGQVRQSFSHGRSKMVTVEVRKKRTYVADSGGLMAEVKSDLEAGLPPGSPAEAEALLQAVDAARPAAPSLTTEEKAARARALEDAMKGEDMADSPVAGVTPFAEAVEADAERAAEEEARRRIEEEERRKAEGEERRQADEEAHRREEMAKASASAAAAKLQALEEGEKEKEKKGRGAKRQLRAEGRQQFPSARRGEPRRRSGRLTIVDGDGEPEERTRSLASVRRAREKHKQQFQLSETTKVVRDVVIPETITVQELANRMAERATDVIRTLMKMDVMATVNQEIDADTAELVATEFGHKFTRVSESDVEIGLKGGEDDEAHLAHRAPVVTVMGHVDHGKTSLLDALRQTDVVSGEAGGITQHIGAYQVTVPSGVQITFIDTPGHAAFTDMRARGARVTDIVVLVVAADDGIMPQTVEAINHAKAAEVPIIVAINKMDKPGADAGRVRTDLLQHDVVVEEMGGEILSVEISAKQHDNLDKLVEAILLLSEILDLKANPDRPAEGVVIEAKMVHGRGSVATVLVQRGTLRLGDIFVAGCEWGRVRALMDDHGEAIEEAGPAVPVEVPGLSGVPSAGDDVAVVDSESRARQVTSFRQHERRVARAAASKRGTLEEMFARIEEGEADRLPVVIKTDAHGSEEAILAALEKIGTDEVKVDILHSGVGGINESDVTLAGASKALIIGFNVRANRQAQEQARRDGVDIRYYAIIYNLIDDLKQALSGMLAPTLRELLLGNAEIRNVFNISKVGKVAGCMVVDGMVRRGARVRLVRDNVVIHEGSLSQLKRFKDDAKEVKEGYECGMAFENYHDIQTGDIIECFEIEEVAREL